MELRAGKLPGHVVVTCVVLFCAAQAWCRTRTWGRRARWVSVFLAGIGMAALCHAHEPYLLLSANADGTFTAEAGFSDQSSTEGLKLIVRDRATSDVLAEHALPADGKLTLEIPAVPYRVVFDGGPGHRVSKPGPSIEPMNAEQTVATESKVTSPDAIQASRPVIADESFRIVLIVGMFFLFGAVAFALGFGAGRRSK